MQVPVNAPCSPLVSAAVNIKPAARKQSPSLQPTDGISMNIDEIPGQNPKQAELIHVHVVPRPPLPSPAPAPTKSSVVGEKPRGAIIDAARLGISLEPTRSAVDVSSA